MYFLGVGVLWCLSTALLCDRPAGAPLVILADTTSKKLCCVLVGVGCLGHVACVCHGAGGVGWGLPELCCLCSPHYLPCTAYEVVGMGGWEGAYARFCVYVHACARVYVSAHVCVLVLHIHILSLTHCLRLHGALVVTLL